MDRETTNYKVPEKLGKIRRFFKITKELAPISLKMLRDRKKYIIFGEPRELTEEQKKQRARELSQKLVNLGPTFIKIAQLMSTRPDLLPREYIKELSKLQDQVPPAPLEEVRKRIEEEIGPINERFDSFDEEPVAGASLGQVHKATVNGEEVAVKINRPHIEELIETDISILKNFIPFVKKFAGTARAYSMKNIVDEFSKVIQQEMDYRREGDHMERIRKNLQHMDYAKIPKVKWTHTTQDVLTMEYIDGVKIKYPEKLREMDFDTHEIAYRINQIYLTMVIRDGVFQADPHPGNIAVTPDGSIALYDFGMSGEIGPDTKQKVTRLYLSLARRDARGIIKALVSLGTLKPGVKINVLERAVEKGMRELEERKEWRAQEFLETIQSIIYQYPFKIPAHLALLIRMAVIIEGECRELEPGFNFIDSAKHYIKTQGVEREQVERKIKKDLVNLEKSLEVATKTPQKADNLIDQIRRGEIDINTQIEDPDKILDNLATRVVMGLLAGSSLIFSGLMMDKNTTLAGAGMGLSFLFLIGFLLSSREKEKEPWESKKPVF